MINSKDIIKLIKALIIMRYCKNYSSIREGMQAAMSIETLLQDVASSGNGHDSILAVAIPQVQLAFCCCHSGVHLVSVGTV